MKFKIPMFSTNCKLAIKQCLQDLMLVKALTSTISPEVAFLEQSGAYHLLKTLAMDLEEKRYNLQALLGSPKYTNVVYAISMLTHDVSHVLEQLLPGRYFQSQSENEDMITWTVRNRLLTQADFDLFIGGFLAQFLIATNEQIKTV
jgi:hypothetical protein